MYPLPAIYSVQLFQTTDQILLSQVLLGEFSSPDFYDILPFIINVLKLFEYKIKGLQMV